MAQKRSAALLALASLMVWSTGGVFAETGVTDKDILLGTTNVMSGPSEFYGRETNIGVDAYFDAINEKGGINGRKVRVLHEDDKYEPETAIVCFQHLMSQGVFGILGTVGSAPLAKYLPMSTNFKVPAVGFYAGPHFVNEPVKRYAFTARAPYRQEMHETVEHLWNDLGVRRIAVIYQNDAYGADELEGVREQLRKHKADVVATGSYMRNLNNVSEAINDVKKGNPEAVVLAAVYAPCTQILKIARQTNWHPLFFMNSGDGIDPFIAHAGADAEGVLFTEVAPAWSSADIPGIADYRKALKQFFPNEKPNYVSLRGYLDAMAFGEGLKRAGRDLTREGFVQSMESIRKADIGMGKGMELSYSPADHLGFHKVFFAMVKNGQPVALTEWKSLKSIASASK